MRTHAESLVQVDEIVEQLHELLRTSFTERHLVSLLLRQAAALRASIEDERFLPAAHAHSSGQQLRVGLL